MTASEKHGAFLGGTSRPPGTGPLSPILAALAAAWREKAAELEPHNAGSAHSYRRCAVELDAALREAAHEALTLAQAAEESGLSVDHVRHLIAAGALPQAGRKGAPRVRRGDLPTKPTKGASSTYDPAADALSLARRRRAL